MTNLQCRGLCRGWSFVFKTQQGRIQGRNETSQRSDGEVDKSKRGVIRKRGRKER